MRLRVGKAIRDWMIRIGEKGSAINARRYGFDPIDLPNGVLKERETRQTRDSESVA